MPISKIQKQDTCIQKYLETTNPSTNFNSYIEFIKTHGDKKDVQLFTEKTFEKRILQELIKQIPGDKQRKQFIKDYKNGFEKYGSLHLESLKIKDKSIVGTLWGHNKQQQKTIVEIDGTISPYKELYNKKNTRLLMKVYKINWNTFNNVKPQYIVISNQYGVHFRKSNCFLQSFVETAALRKQFELKPF